MNEERSAAPRARWRAWLALLVVALAAACGGGGGGVDTGGTGAAVASYANGRISGFGSIIVNEVHFDESGAVIVDDAGRPRAPGDLRLGMTVEVEAGPIVVDPDTQTRRSDASRIAFGSEIVGPVEAVDAAASTARVLGQTVKLDVNTVLEGFAALAELGVGDVVEVFAFFDPSSGTYTATRIERAPAADAYKLRGPVANLDTAARTFSIGGAAIRYADVPDGELPGLAAGAIVRVELRPVQRDGRWEVLRASTPQPTIPASVETEIEGFVTEFEGLSRFRVDGAIVDASAPGVAFEKGNPEQLGNGDRIEVEGRMQDGVLMAERIEVLRGNSGGGNAPPEERKEFKVSGTIESADAAARRFVVRGITVTFDDATRFDKGDRADLRAGIDVDVRGTLAGGNQLHAERIRVGKDD